MSGRCYMAAPACYLDGVRLHDNLGVVMAGAVRELRQR